MKVTRSILSVLALAMISHQVLAAPVNAGGKSQAVVKRTGDILNDVVVANVSALNGGDGVKVILDPITALVTGGPHGGPRRGPGGARGGPGGPGGAHGGPQGGPGGPHGGPGGAHGSDPYPPNGIRRRDDAESAGPSHCGHGPLNDPTLVVLIDPKTGPCRGGPGGQPHGGPGHSPHAPLLAVAVDANIALGHPHGGPHGGPQGNSNPHSGNGPRGNGRGHGNGNDNYPGDNNHGHGGQNGNRNYPSDNQRYN
ncbi:hypothetical protein IWQ61_008821 [Dispira simplex]|nr:hypothetical protein IWQ61_008821 [Dispira simplex]